jgi:hypothetical protein
VPKLPLKNRLTLVLIVVMGWVLAVSYLMWRPAGLPEWGCYVPLVLGVATALVYQRRLVGRLAEPAESGSAS